MNQIGGLDPGTVSRETRIGVFDEQKISARLFARKASVVGGVDDLTDLPTTCFHALALAGVAAAGVLAGVAAAGAGLMIVFSEFAVEAPADSALRSAVESTLSPFMMAVFWVIIFWRSDSKSGLLL